MNELRHALTILAIGGIALTGKTAEPRTDRVLETGWRFIKQDVAGAEAPSFKDSSWQSVRLPHTFNAEDGTNGVNNGRYYRGPGWYRLHLQLGTKDLNKSLFLRFGAATLISDTFVNGRQLGHHEGGFAAFCYDISKVVHLGDNVVAVKVDNTHSSSVPPLSGDFTVYGGLTREVRLLELNPVSITPLDDASSGVYIKQTLKDTSASAIVKTRLRNGLDLPVTAEVITKVLDAAGKQIALSTEQVAIPARGTADSGTELNVPHPHLWDGVLGPYLYKTVVEVRNGGKVVDRVSQPLGFRTFRVDPERGMVLNGKPFDMHGVNLHQGRPATGWAATPKMQDEDYSIIHELGATGVRMAHYQHADHEYELCDQYGIMVWAELCLVNQMTDTPAFRNNAKQQLRELIKQNYNHPSILMWSMYNEPWIDKKKGDKEWQLVPELVEEAHALDPDRLTTGAVVLDGKQWLDWCMDITGINRYWGWYYDPLASWPRKLDELRKEAGGRSYGMSEYGAGASVIQHENEPKQPGASSHWHPEEWQSKFHEVSWKAMDERPWMWCKLVWAMFDFPVSGRDEGDRKGINDKGLVTGDRKIKKDAFYFYKANWSSAPFVYVTERRYTPRPSGINTLKVYSNCPTVELFLNGKSLGVKEAKDHIFEWPGVNLTLGKTVVKAVAKGGGKTFEDTVSWQIEAGAK